MSTNQEDVVIYCYLAYVGPFWFIGLFSGSRNRALRFHVNQGLVLFIFEIIAIVLARIAGGLLGMISFADVGTWLSRLVWLAAGVGMIYFSAHGMLNVAKNRRDPLPLIGGFRLIR